MTDEPLVFDQSDSPFRCEIIDLAEHTIRHGRPKDRSRVCRHRHLIYSSTERRVWCEDCERTIDGFDAFRVLAEHFEKMLKEATSKQREVEQAKASVIHLIAAKEIERTWRGKMAAVCPHCHAGLLPEDFVGMGSGQRSRDLEIARRKRVKSSGEGQ